MGKSDQKRTQNEITRTVDQNQANTNSGISQTGERVQNLIGRSDAERSEIQDNYRGWMDNGGITDEEVARLRNGGGSSSANNSGGSGGGGGGVAALPDYLQTWYQMQGEHGGFDETRLANINTATDKLRNASKDYTDTDTSIHGLQDFAKTGGIRQETLDRIYDPTLQEFSRTGGYSDADKANIRSRSNSGISSYYSNLKDTLDRNRVGAGANVNAGTVAGNAFRLARANAQDTATASRNTEMDINEAVRQGRMAAASKLGDLGTQVAGIQSANTLSGYDKAGQLDLTKQKQIEDAIAAGGNLDLSTQMGINQSRLAATSGISQDTLGRMQISAAQAAANAALAAANERFIIGQRQQGRFEANQGLLNTYGTGPQELEFNQNLLRDYRRDQASDNFNTINARIGASQIPGIGSTLSSGLNVAGQAMGLGAGMMPGLGNLFSSSRNTGFAGGYEPNDTNGWG